MHDQEHQSALQFSSGEDRVQNYMNEELLDQLLHEMPLEQRSYISAFELPFLSQYT